MTTNTISISDRSRSPLGITLFPSHPWLPHPNPSMTSLTPPYPYYKTTPTHLPSAYLTNNPKTKTKLLNYTKSKMSDDRRHWHGTSGDRHEHHNVWTAGGAKGPTSRAPWALTPEMMANLNARKVFHSSQTLLHQPPFPSSS